MTTIKRATIKAYNAASHKATVQIAGSLAVWLADVPVASDIQPAEALAERACTVLFYTDDNPDDAVVLSVHGVLPAPLTVQDVTQLVLGTIRNTSPPAGQIGLTVDVGGTTAPGASTIVGVAGRALAQHASTQNSYGLDYLAGTAGVSLLESNAVRVQIFGSGSGKTITTGRNVLAKGPSMVLATVTTFRHLDLEPITTGTNRQPIHEAGVNNVTGDTHGNALCSNTQFGSTTRSFGGGNGVIGIANAVANPSTNPTGGGVLYASGGALLWRGERRHRNDDCASVKVEKRTQRETDMANRVITLTPDAEARLNVLVAEYNAANGTTLNLPGWITLHLRELAIERELLGEAGRLRTQADADVVAAVQAERVRLLATL